MKNNNRREKLLAITAAAVIGLLAVDRMAIRPLTQLWKDRATRIEELNTSINKGELLTARADDIRRRWAEMQSGTLPDNRPDAENLILKALSEWNKFSRITFTAIKPQWKNVDEDHSILECRAAVTGDMEAITRFIYALEDDELPLRVENMQLSAQDKNGQELSLDIVFSGLLLNQEQ